MDFHTGLVMVCMLFAHACCHPLEKDEQEEVVASTVKPLMKKIQSMINDLSAAPGLVSNNSCSTLKIMELLPSAQQPHTVHIFCCYMQEFAGLIVELSKRLMDIAQIMQDLERLLSNQTSPKNCSLLTFNVSSNPHNDAMCFLQHVEKILPNF